MPPPKLSIPNNKQVVPPMVQKSAIGWSNDINTAAMYGEHTAGGIGVYGVSDEGEGVRGWTMAANANSPGVKGLADGNGQGVWGESKNGEGVRGISHAAGHGGVVGVNDNGSNNAGPGVYGESTKGEAVRGMGHSPDHAAVAGTNDHPAGIGVYGKGGRLAAWFEGDIEVTGDIRLLNADCAEDFDASSSDVEPGTVMVAHSDGRLRPSEQSYDKRVAGVVSGAGKLRPAIVLDSHGCAAGRVPIALVGKVYCKVDASSAPIEVGDLLTTSSTPGHAMKAADSMRAFGSVIGKALQALSEGAGLIPILIALQ